MHIQIIFWFYYKQLVFMWIIYYGHSRNNNKYIRVCDFKWVNCIISIFVLCKILWSVVESIIKLCAVVLNHIKILIFVHTFWFCIIHFLKFNFTIKDELYLMSPWKDEVKFEYKTVNYKTNRLDLTYQN